MPPGLEQKFTAGAQPVAWSIAEGASGGTIDGSGTYTAPQAPGTYHVVAQRDGLTATATVRVSITPGVTVTVDPPAADLAPGDAMQLKATVSGAPDRTVFWFVREGDSGGQIDAAGRYSAPVATGLFHVVAVSEADPSKFASAAISVSVRPTITVSIDPPAAALKPGTGTKFIAAVTGTVNTGVRWFVAEGTAGGTLDAQGRYVAPSSEGTYHLVAASDADPAQSATAEVKVARSVTVALTPEVATVQAGATQTFAAAVSGSDPRVAWSIAEGTAGGLVDGHGVYHAPPLPGIFHLVATSLADPSRSATAVITVPAQAISVAVTPGIATLKPGQSVQLSAAITGSPEQRVLWSAENGAVAQDGLYTAPSSTGTFRVTAQSFADPTKSGSAFITVVADVLVQIDPAQVILHTGDLRQFSARVGGTSDVAVAWSVQEPNGGKIDANGIYTAPRTEGVFHVAATSHADPTKTAVAAVTVSYFDLIDKGGPVAPATRTFALFWGDPSAWPSDARPTVEALLSGLNGSGYLAIADQYMRGRVTTTAFGGSLFDGSPAPTSGDPAAIGARACAALTTAGVTPASGDFVAVYGAAPLASATYCAWHWYASCGTATILVAWVPNPAGTTCVPASNPCSSASKIASALANSTAHELFESITDPYAGSWMDAEGEEAADKCQDALRCVRIGTATFQLQPIYSNATHACSVP